MRRTSTQNAGRILPNEQLEIQGRIAFMVKLRGYTVVPGGIETTIIEHELINTAVVLTENSDQANQPEHLVAYLVGHQKLEESDIETLRAHLRDHLPHYAVPSYLIALDELPIAANGKLDRSRLPKPDPSMLKTSSIEGPISIIKEYHGYIYIYNKYSPTRGAAVSCRCSVEGW